MLSNSNYHLFWLLQFIWTVFTISSPSSIIRQTTLIGSLLFFTAFQSRINTQSRLFMEWAFCMRCLCQGSVNSIVHTLCIFNQKTVTQQSVRKGRKEKHMQDTIFCMSCHWKTRPINVRELYAKLYFTDSEKWSELIYRTFPAGQGGKRNTWGFTSLFVLIP